MSDQIQITIAREVYDRLQRLMVPPLGDVNAVIETLLYHDGRSSPAALALEAGEQHFTYAQELQRASEGVYDCGGCT